MNWLRGRVDLVLGLVVVAAWAAVAVEADRAMRASTAAAAEALARSPARSPRADAAPVPGTATLPISADRPTRI